MWKHAHAPYDGSKLTQLLPTPVRAAVPLATFTALAWLMVAFFPDVAAEHLPDTKLPTFDNYTSRCEAALTAAEARRACS